MNQYKLLALDLDGTLLNENCTIPPTTIELIKKIHSKTMVTIATGRTFYSAHHFASQLGIDIPLIACNGTIIKTALTEKVMFRNHLSTFVISTVVSICTKHNIYYHGYSEECIYLVDHNDITNKDGDTNLAPCMLVKDLLNLKQGTLLKLTVMGTKDEMAVARKDIESQTNALVIQITPTHLEIIENGATKGTSLKLLANSYNINRENVIACGDGENDLEMINWAGLGIAVFNANKKLKEQADYITKNSSSAGVEEVIKKFIL